MTKENKKNLIIGLASVIIALGLFVYVLISGSIYAKAVFDKSKNTIVVKGVLSKKELANFRSVKSFDMKSDYGYAGLCYNIEMKMVKDEVKMLFPFCIPDSVKIKNIIKELEAFAAVPMPVVKQISLFSKTNLICLLIGILSMIIGLIKIRKSMPENY